MTKQEHWDAYRAHWETAMTALRTCITAGHTDAKWQEYKDEMRIANKHRGTVRRMKNGALRIGG